MHKYRKQVVNILLLLLVLFSIIALYAFIHLQNKTSVLNIGLSYFEENMIIIGLSVLSMVKVIWELYKVEHPREFERRVFGNGKEKE